MNILYIKNCTGRQTKVILYLNNQGIGTILEQFFFLYNYSEQTKKIYGTINDVNERRSNHSNQNVS